MKEVFVADIDIPTGRDEVDILSKLKRVVRYLDTALECKAQLIGRLQTRDAFRIRIRGIYVK